MRKWVLYVDVILLITALLILVIDFQTKQDILRATREFYDVRRQAEGHKGRNNSTSGVPDSVLPAIPDDFEPVQNAEFVEYDGASGTTGEQEIVLPRSFDPDAYTRSDYQGIPGKREQVGT